MPTRKNPSLAATAALVAVALLAAPTQADEPLPFELPIPDGWRTETIQFPLEFAPDLPYTGLEELRFAPGMFEAGDDEFWTYAFVWWVGVDEPNTADALSAHLASYFRGLAVAVAESREIEAGSAGFSASLAAGQGRSFSGTAETLDAFVSNVQILLNVRGEIIHCPDQQHQAIVFTLSPQDPSHAVWTTLDSIRSGFACAGEA